MSGGGNQDAFGMVSDWTKQDFKEMTDPKMLNPVEALINQPIKKGKDIAESLTGQGKKTNDLKGLFMAPPKVDQGASAVSQIAQLERNIEGGSSAGAIDAQTKEDIYQELRGGANNQSVSYEDQTARVGQIQERLDQIAAGKDMTVNDRQRLNNQLLVLRDRPGRGGLLTGG